MPFNVFCGIVDANTFYINRSKSEKKQVRIKLKLYIWKRRGAVVLKKTAHYATHSTFSYSIHPNL